MAVQIGHLYELNDSEWELLLNAWREQNDAGNGDDFDFGVDEDGYSIDGTVADAIDQEEVSLLAQRGNQAIVRIGDASRTLMIFDTEGRPWVCDVTEAWQRIVSGRI